MTDPVPEFSVTAVVLNWRDAARTRRCVQQLLFADALVSVLVVDNESDGSLRQHLGDFSSERVRLIEVEGNRGFAGGINHGLAAAVGADAVLVINNDALIDPPSINALISTLRSQPHVGLVGPRIINPDSSVQSNGGRISRLTGIARQNRSRGRIDYLSWACVLVRADLLRSIGLLDDSYFMYWEDVDFSLRARAAGHSLKLAESACARHELSASGEIVGRRLASYYAASLLRFGEKHGGLVRARTWAALSGLLLSRVVRWDWDGVRALVRGARLPRPIAGAWRVDERDGYGYG